MIKNYINPTKEEIVKYQELLSEVLTLSKITRAELGEYIGITRQQVANLDTCHCPMSKTQYITINVVLEYVIGEEKYKKILKMAKELKEL